MVVEPGFACLNPDVSDTKLFHSCTPGASALVSPADAISDPDHRIGALADMLNLNFVVVPYLGSEPLTVVLLYGFIALHNNALGAYSLAGEPSVSLRVSHVALMI